MAKVTLTVNGKKVEKDVADNTLLVSFIRDNLNLTGTHVGCDTSQCGACVVHVNGKSVKSCAMFAVDANGSEVTTIEGLEKDGKLHPVQEVFQKAPWFAMWILYPGMVMSSIDLLKTHKNPSEEEIRKGLEGNICRCTGYQNIVASVKGAIGKV